MTDMTNRRQLCVAAALTLSAPWAALAQERAALEIGLLPNISARVLLAQYQPMREFLERETRRVVQFSTAPNWAAFQQRTNAAGYDLIVTAAHLGRLAQLDHGWQPLLGYVPDIRALLVVPVAKPLRSVAELRGQVLVLSNPQSLVTMRGMQWLAEQSLQRERDFTTIRTPTDDSVGNVLVRGDAAAAMLSGGEFRAIPEAVRNQLQVLASFAEVPGFVVMASPRLPAADARALRELLLRFSQRSEEGQAFFKATGFSALRELPAGLMESLDPYVEATRRALAG